MQDMQGADTQIIKKDMLMSDCLTLQAGDCRVSLEKKYSGDIYTVIHEVLISSITWEGIRRYMHA